MLSPSVTHGEGSHLRINRCAQTMDCATVWQGKQAVKLIYCSWTSEMWLCEKKLQGRSDAQRDSVARLIKQGMWDSSPPREKREQNVGRLFFANSPQPTLTRALHSFLLFKCFMIPRSSAVFFSAGLSPSSPGSILPNPFPSLRPPSPPLTSVFFLWGLTVLFCTVGWIPGIRPPLITHYLCGKKKPSEAQIRRGFESN